MRSFAKQCEGPVHNGKRSVCPHRFPKPSSQLHSLAMNALLRPFALAAMLVPLVAFAAGRPMLNAYFQQTLQSASYQQKAFEKVANAWRQPGKKGRPELGKKTVVSAVIALDGSVVSTEIKMTSGSQAWDKAALAAVKKAAPFARLPDGFSYPTLEAHFHFAWAK